MQTLKNVSEKKIKYKTTTTFN